MSDYIWAFFAMSGAGILFGAAFTQGAMLACKFHKWSPVNITINNNKITCAKSEAAKGET